MVTVDHEASLGKKKRGNNVIKQKKVVQLVEHVTLDLMVVGSVGVDFIT